MVFCLVACQNPNSTSKQETVNKAELEKVAGELMDRYYESNKSENNDDLNEIIADRGIVMGTDPNEVWDKNQLLENYEQYRQDPEMAQLLANLSFDIKDRRTIISENGSQAIVVDVVKTSFSELDTRSMSIIEKEGGEWKIVFANVAFLINNSDLARIDSLIIQ